MRAISAYLRNCQNTIVLLTCDVLSRNIQKAESMYLKKVHLRHNSTARIYIRPLSTILVLATKPQELTPALVARDVKRAVGRDVSQDDAHKWLKYVDKHGRKNVKKVPESTWSKDTDNVGSYLWNIVAHPDIAERANHIVVMVDNGDGPHDFFKIT